MPIANLKPQPNLRPLLSHYIHLSASSARDCTQLAKMRFSACELLRFELWAPCSMHSKIIHRAAVRMCTESRCRCECELNLCEMRKTHSHCVLINTNLIHKYNAWFPSTLCRQYT